MLVHGRAGSSWWYWPVHSAQTQGEHGVKNCTLRNRWSLTFTRQARAVGFPFTVNRGLIGHLRTIWAQYGKQLGCNFSILGWLCHKKHEGLDPGAFRAEQLLFSNIYSQWESPEWSVHKVKVKPKESGPTQADKSVREQARIYDRSTGEAEGKARKTKNTSQEVKPRCWVRGNQPLGVWSGDYKIYKFIPHKASGTNGILAQDLSYKKPGFKRFPGAYWIWTNEWTTK